MMTWDAMQYDIMKWYASEYQLLSQPYVYDTPRKYIESSWPMGNSQGPYTGTDDLHEFVRTISTHYHKSNKFRMDDPHVPKS